MKYVTTKILMTALILILSAVGVSLCCLLLNSDDNVGFVVGAFCFIANFVSTINLIRLTWSSK